MKLCTLCCSGCCCCCCWCWRWCCISCLSCPSPAQACPGTGSVALSRDALSATAAHTPSAPPVQALVAVLPVLSSVTAPASGASAKTSLSASACSSKATASKWCGSSSAVLLARHTLLRHRSKYSRRGMVVQARLGGRSTSTWKGQGETKFRVVEGDGPFMCPYGWPSQRRMSVSTHKSTLPIETQPSRLLPTYELKQCRGMSAGSRSKVSQPGFGGMTRTLLDKPSPFTVTLHCHSTDLAELRTKHRHLSCTLDSGPSRQSELINQILHQRSGCIGA